MHSKDDFDAEAKRLGVSRKLTPAERYFRRKSSKKRHQSTTARLTALVVRLGNANKALRSENEAMAKQLGIEPRSST